jgi:hypothetical protein
LGENTICGAAASFSAWLGCQYMGVAQFFSGITFSCAFSPVNIKGKKTREKARPAYFEKVISIFLSGQDFSFVQSVYTQFK